jgi:hypothetical protein
MAVNKEQTGGQGQTGQSAGSTNEQMKNAYAQAESQRGGAGRQQSQQQAGMFSFLNPNSFSNIPLARGQASEVLINLEKAFKETLEQLNPSFEATLIPIDWNNNQDLDVSSLVVAVRYKDNQNQVAFTPLLLEGSVDPKDPVFANVSGFNTEITFVVGDAYNEKMMAIVKDEVARHFPQCTLLPSAAVTVPRDFKIDNKTGVYNLAVNTALACSAELDQANPQFRDLNLKNAKGDASLVIRPTFGQGQIMDATMQPVRADITVTLTAEPMQQQQQGMYSNNGAVPQSPGRSSVVSQVCGFVDLVWAPQAPVANQFSPTGMGGLYQQAQAQNFRRYLPRIVLTACVSRFGLTPASQLFALLTSAVLRQNNLWAQTFRRDPSTPVTGVDYNDIGALGIECNFQTGGTDGVRIDTRAASFGALENEQLISSLIEPTPLLSIDVEETGANTYATGIYAAAAEGDPGANAALVNALDTLFNGCFSRHFPAGARLFVDEVNRIHQGHYQGPNGPLDLRTIGYLYVANAVGDKDPSVIKAWSDTYFNTAPLLKRLADRKSIIEKLVDRPVFTGYYRRVTATPELIDAMLKASEEVGLAMRTQVPYSDQQGHARATGSFEGMALGQMNTTTFNRYGNQQGPQNFAGNRTFHTGQQW